MSSSSSIPSELILQIFSHLPGKTVQKFRIASKQFNSLISDPYLRHLHHHHALNSSSVLIAFTGPYRTLTIDLKLFFFTKPNDVATTIFVADTAFHTDLFKLELFFTIEDTLKPITKRFLGEKVKVFSSNHQFIFILTDKEHFLFDPINQKTLKIPQSSSSHLPNDSFISFGFVSSTLQYKIIRFFHPHQSICKFEVLTLTITGRDYSHYLEMSTWKSKEEQCPYLLESYPPVHANGFLYWTTKEVLKIVSFSLEEEKFSVLSPPPYFEDNPNHNFSLCGIRRDLWVVDYNPLAPNMELWMMSGSNGSAWVKTHCINLKETLVCYYASFPINFYHIESKCVVFQVLFPSMLHLCETSTNEVKDCGVSSRSYFL